MQLTPTHGAAGKAARRTFVLPRKTARRSRFLLIAAALIAAPVTTTRLRADVLPDDRADALYHRYQGGGVTIQGPSVLVRKKIGDNFSVNANYYVDMVSSASVDVKLTASPYTERREQKSLGFDYLRGKTTYSVDYINSEESDYKANTASFGISQDMFGDLTTVSLGYSRGWNDVFRNIKEANGEKMHDPSFTSTADTRAYRVGLTQILTRSMILNLNFEVDTDQGFLNSPYRSVRYVDPTSALGYSFEPEIYPHTHTSSAASARLKYFLPYRASIDGSYRYYDDTWGIGAHTVELTYTHPWKHWIFDARARYYRQNQADFYSDLFPRRDYANFLARDKEMAAFQSYSVGFGASYDFSFAKLRWVQKSSLNVRFDHLLIRYDDFRNALLTNPSAGITAGTEPLYQLDANVLELFLSVWY